MKNRWRFILVCVYLTPFILGFSTGFHESQHMPEPVKITYAFSQLPLPTQNLSREREIIPASSPGRIDIIAKTWAYNTYMFLALNAKSPTFIPDMIWFYTQGRWTGLGVQSLQAAGEHPITKMLIMGAVELSLFLSGIIATTELFYDFLIEMMLRKKPLTQRALFTRWGLWMIIGVMAFGVLAIVENSV